MTYNEETGIDLAFSLKVKTLLDAKLCNYYPNGENYTMVVEDIPGYLSRVRGDMRSAGALVVIMVPLDGNTSAGTVEHDYDSFDGSGYIPRYYTFKGGLADANFVKVNAVKNTYVAWASTDAGTGFSLVPNSTLGYIAILITGAEIPNPVAADFAGLWYLVHNQPTPATETNQGIVKIVTLTEALAGEDDFKAVTALKMRSVLQGYAPYYGAIDDVHLGDFDLTAKDIIATGVIKSTGGDSSEWDAAYDYSLVKHLPLAGGTMANENLVTKLNADKLDGKHGDEYQLKLTNPVTGTGTAGKIVKFTAAGVVGDSKITETVTGVLVNGEIVVTTAKHTTGATNGYFWKCTNEDGSGGWFPVAASQVYKGTWDASLGVAPVGTTNGWYYRVTVAGTWNGITWNIGDDISYNGSVWQQIPTEGFQLQVATATILGGIKIGAGLAADDAGVTRVTGYRHYQGTAATIWNVAHNLGKYPSCTIVDSAGTEYEGEVKHTDANNLVITLSAGFSGYADIN